MGKLVTPEVYYIGATALDSSGLEEYLRATGNEEFLELVAQAREQGLSEGEILCSFYAKLCYASLTLGKNQNVTQVRDILGNLRGCFAAGHGSVFEHCQLNFVITNCSRVLTHELVRHRVGTAFSQTSGRYVRSDQLDVVADPLLQEHGILFAEEQQEVQEFLERYMLRVGERINALKADFNLKKKLTSAARRWLPNGQANEIGFSVNIRALRHIVQLRTAGGAEWEIRVIFGKIYQLVKARFPTLFTGAREELVDGLLQVSGLKTQPYEG